MLSEKELLYFIALQKAKGIGPVNARKLIQLTGSAEAVFQTPKPELMRAYKIGSKILDALKDPLLMESAQQELDYILYHDIPYVSFLDKDYPPLLLQCHDAPLLLFYKGDVQWDNRPVISVVGTRKMTSYGRKFIEEFMRDIAEYRPIIVSGYAYGVDITAHLEALKNGLTTVAVMAHGLDITYPKAHEMYAAEILENGAFYTEYHHDEKIIREHFVERNRIVAGMSEAVIVVESNLKGGSMITAEIAQSYGRDVFAVPGRRDDVWSKGCNRLIRNNKAAILNNAEDLIYYLNWNKKTRKEPVVKQTRLFVELEGDEKVVFDYLKENGKTLLDNIAIDTGIPVYRLSSILLNMELSGYIEPLPGKIFQTAH